VGSIPNNTTTIKSHALKVFINDVGKAVSCLNTSAVGLDAVEKGYEKPESLNISWNPEDRESAARIARKFIIESTLVRVTEAFGEFANSLASLPKFATLKESWQRENIKKADRYEQLAKSIMTENTDSFLIAAVCLMANWRNKIVHPSSSKATISKLQIQIFENSSLIIFEKYAGLKTKKLIEDFEKNKPTLKDITSLISMTINLARQLDNGINYSSSKDVESSITHYKLDGVIEKIIRETSKNKVEASIRRLYVIRESWVFKSL